MANQENEKRPFTEAIRRRNIQGALWQNHDGNGKATSLLTYARRINGGRPDGRILLNKVKRRDRISKGLPDAAAALGVTIFRSQIRDLQAFRDAAQQATTIHRMKPSPIEAQLDMQAFFEELYQASKLIDQEAVRGNV